MDSGRGQDGIVKNSVVAVSKIQVRYFCPAGAVARMGSIWKAVLERSGNAYLSIAFSSPTGTQHRANALHREGAVPGLYELVPYANGEMAVVA